MAALQSYENFERAPRARGLKYWSVNKEFLLDFLLNGRLREHTSFVDKITPPQHFRGIQTGQILVISRVKDPIEILDLKKFATLNLKIAPLRIPSKNVDKGSLIIAVVGSETNNLKIVPAIKAKEILNALKEQYIPLENDSDLPTTNFDPFLLDDPDISDEMGEASISAKI